MPLTLTKETKEITYKNGDVIKVDVGKSNVVVKLSLGGKTYTGKSNNKNIASFSVGKKPGNYKVKFYIKDSNYKGSKKSSITINQLPLEVNYSPGLTLKKNKDLTLTFINHKNKIKYMVLKLNTRLKVIVVIIKQLIRRVQ